MKLNWIKASLLVGVLLLSAACTGVRVRGSGTVISENRELRDFDSVQLESFGDVFIEQGDETSVIVEADVELLEYVNTEVRGGTLYLRVGDRGQNVYVTNAELRFLVTVTDLEALTVSGSGDMFVEDLSVDDLDIGVNGSGDIAMQDIDGAALTIGINGSGDIDIKKAEVDEITSRIQGSGNVDVSGETTNHTIRIEGSGDYDAGDVESQAVEISIRGAGNVDTWAVESLAIDIDGSGNVRYHGSPDDIRQQIDGSGDVRSLGDK